MQPIGAPILHDLTPETLKRVRVALGIRQTRLAAEASLSAAVICMTELGRSQTRVTTLEAIGDALTAFNAGARVRLAAVNPAPAQIRPEVVAA